MSQKQDWPWLSQWAPTFAVVVALLAAVIPASFHLGGEIARLDEGQAELKAGLARLEARMESLFAELRAEMRADRATLANVRERVSALEAAKPAS